jgi:pimeloyl-ACP methyl ester carboxylesterase
VARTRRTAAGPTGFTERFAKVNGVRLRYLIGGQGSPVALLHGYAETGHMWRPIMPSLAQRHSVIVPDLRGAGGSAKPAAGYDKKTMALDIHELTSSLKFDRVRIVGHDIARQWPGLAERRACASVTSSRNSQPAARAACRGAARAAPERTAARW